MLHTLLQQQNWLHANLCGVAWSILLVWYVYYNYIDVYCMYAYICNSNMYICIYIYNTHTTLYSLHGFMCCLHWNWKVSSAQSPLSGPEKAEATQLLQKARWVFRDAIPIAKRCRIPPDHTCLRHSIPTWHTHTHPVFVRNVSITQPPEKHGQGYSMCSQAFGALLRDWRDRGTSIQLKVKTMRLFV